MAIMLPGEADAAMDLDRIHRYRAIGLRRQNLGTGDQRTCLFASRKGGNASNRQRLGGFEIRAQIGATMLQRLERADLPAKLPPSLRVFDRFMQDYLGPANTVAGNGQIEMRLQGLWRIRRAGMNSLGRQAKADRKLPGLKSAIVQAA